MKNKISTRFLLIFMVVGIILCSNLALALNDLLSLEMRVTANNMKADGDLIVTIWNHSTWGYGTGESANLIYNSTDDYDGDIVGGSVHAMLGDNVALNLIHNQHFWLDIAVNDTNLNFDGNADRLEFSSPIGDVNESILGFNITAGDLNVETGNINVDAGDVAIDVGNLTMDAGNISAEHIIADNATITNTLTANNLSILGSTAFDGDENLIFGNITSLSNISAMYMFASNDLEITGNATITTDLSAQNSIFTNTTVTTGFAYEGADALFDGNVTISGDLSANDVIFSGNSEISGNQTIVGDLSADAVIISGDLQLADDKNITLGSGDDVSIEFDTAQTNDALVLGLDTGSHSIIITEATDMAVDYAIPIQTNPSAFVTSSTGSTNEWIQFTHDSQKGIIDVGGDAIGASGNTANVTEIASQLHVNQNMTVDSDLLISSEESQDELFYMQVNGSHMVFVSSPPTMAQMPFWFETSSATFFTNTTFLEPVNITTNITIGTLMKLEDMSSDGSIMCDAEEQGTIIYNATRATICICNGTAFTLVNETDALC